MKNIINDLKRDMLTFGYVLISVEFEINNEIGIIYNYSHVDSDVKFSMSIDIFGTRHTDYFHLIKSYDDKFTKILEDN